LFYNGVFDDVKIRNYCGINANGKERERRQHNPMPAARLPQGRHHIFTEKTLFLFR
jgi:hypothetical protein